MFNKAHWYYIAALIIAGLSLYFYEYTYFRYVNSGFIGYGFFFVVMFVGVLPNKWGLTRNIKKNRGVFSILGFIFISPHAIGHIFKLFWGINIFGIVAFAVMVPLTIISFRVIRREIEPKDWFTIQKGAYIIYFSLFAHLIMVAAWEDKVIYAMLLVLYINNRVLKHYFKGVKK
jgi:DMSO/TMAO reductase YedYZ heme-binding membrane subunit